LSGQWDVQIKYLAGSSKHTLHLKQQGNRIEGSHQGDFVSRDLSGSIDGDTVEISSQHSERHGDSLMFTFSGKVSANEMSGSLDMGEYLKATWTAKRHGYQRG
jgi:L-seryl-tRNA(Ser) seleniumtransferase